jgi:hypothetical protein
LSALALALALTVAGSGEAGTARTTIAEELYTNAEQEEKDLGFAAALHDYEASVAADPSNRWVLRSNARARWLRDRSEGDFAPLVRLERVRRDPSAQRDAATVDALARDLEAFPPGEVRVEARMFAAESYLTQLGRPADGERELDALLDEPASKASGSGPLRAQAASRLVDIAMARGDVASAKRAADRAGSGAPQLGARVVQWARRRVIERASAGVLALFAIGGGVAAARRLRGARVTALIAFMGKAALICVYLATFAAVLAGSYENGHTLPFVMLPLAVLPIAIVARAWGLAGATSPAARALRAIFGAVAVAAAAFLVLDRIDVRYLESFGL